MKPDPKIEQSLAKTAEFLRDYVPAPSATDKDILDEQFRIDLNTPLPQYNTAHAKAFSAIDLQDSRQLYALVCDPAMAAAPGKLSLGKKKHGMLV